jgi:hypothetical protein
MKNTPEHDRRMAEMTFSSVYPHYLSKVTRKGRTEAELLEIIEWLTGFNSEQVELLIQEKVSFKSFFERAQLHENANLISGTICGYRIEEIDNDLTRSIRYLDKLVDDLAKGRKATLRLVGVGGETAL